VGRNLYKNRIQGGSYSSSRRRRKMLKGKDVEVYKLSMGKGICTIYNIRSCTTVREDMEIGGK